MLYLSSSISSVSDVLARDRVAVCTFGSLIWRLLYLIWCCKNAGFCEEHCEAATWMRKEGLVGHCQACYWPFVGCCCCFCWSQVRRCVRDGTWGKGGEFLVFERWLTRKSFKDQLCSDPGVEQSDESLSGSCCASGAFLLAFHYWVAERHHGLLIVWYSWISVWETRPIAAHIRFVIHGLLPTLPIVAISLGKIILIVKRRTSLLTSNTGLIWSRRAGKRVGRRVLLVNDYFF